MSGSKPFYSSYPNDIVKFSISHTHDGKVGTELEVKTCPACGSLEHPLWGEKTCNLKGVTEAKLFPGSNCSVCSFKIEPGQMMARVNLGWAHRDCALQVMHPTVGGTPPSDADIAKVSVSQEMKVGLKSVLQDPGNKLWEKPAGCLKTTALVAIKSLVGEVHTSAVCFNKLAAQNLRDRGVMKASTFDAKAVQALATTYRHRLACFKALPNGDGPLLSNDASVHNSSLPIDNLNVKYKAMLNVLYPANLAPLAHGEKLSDRFSVEYISLQDVVTRGMTLAFNRGYAYGRTSSTYTYNPTEAKTLYRDPKDEGAWLDLLKEFDLYEECIENNLDEKSLSHAQAAELEHKYGVGQALVDNILKLAVTVLPVIFEAAVGETIWYNTFCGQQGLWYLDRNNKQTWLQPGTITFGEVKQIVIKDRLKVASYHLKVIEVDEYQDTMPSNMDLLDLMKHQSDSFCVHGQPPTKIIAVGNMAQAINRFLGAFEDNQLEFMRRFNMAVMTDPHSYRFGEAFATEINKHQKKYIGAFITLAMPDDPVYIIGMRPEPGTIRKDTTLKSHPLPVPEITLVAREKVVTDTYAVIFRNTHEKSLFAQIAISEGHNIKSHGTASNTEYDTTQLYNEQIKWMDEHSVKTLAGAEKWLETRKAPAYKSTRTGMLKLLDNVKTIMFDQVAAGEWYGIVSWMPRCTNNHEVLYHPLGLDVLRSAVEYSYEHDVINLLTIHGIKGQEYDHGLWIERQNTPSSIALCYPETSVKMMQERHLELVGMSRWRKSLNIARTTAKIAGRTDANKLRMILYPPDDMPTEDTTTEAMDASAHVTMRANEIGENTALADALQTLGMAAMPTEGSMISTAVAKRKRDGYDVTMIDTAAKFVRRTLFTAGSSSTS